MMFLHYPKTAEPVSQAIFDQVQAWAHEAKLDNSRSLPDDIRAEGSLSAIEAVCWKAHNSGIKLEVVVSAAEQNAAKSVLGRNATVIVADI